jgi:uncharacterized membrane protein YfcA
MTQFIVLAIVLLAAGALVGFLAGVFGVGGGAVAVPILYQVFVCLAVPDDVLMPLCAGTSLALIIPASIASFWAHRQATAIDIRLLRKWMLPVITGVLGGIILARYASAALFELVFVVIALLTATRLILPQLLPRLGDSVPGRFVAPYGLVIGASASLIGIGGGLLSNIVMMLHGRAIHQAVATSSGVGVMVSLPDTLG